MTEEFQLRNIDKTGKRKNTERIATGVSMVHGEIN